MLTGKNVISSAGFLYSFLSSCSLCMNHIFFKISEWANYKEAFLLSYLLPHSTEISSWSVTATISFSFLLYRFSINITLRIFTPNCSCEPGSSVGVKPNLNLILSTITNYLSSYTLANYLLHAPVFSTVKILPKIICKSGEIIYIK